jgi:hypothetical protein
MTRLFTAVFAAVLPGLLTLTGGLTALTATPDRDHDRLPGRSRAPPGCDAGQSDRDHCEARASGPVW